MPDTRRAVQEILTDGEKRCNAEYRRATCKTQQPQNPENPGCRQKSDGCNDEGGAADNSGLGTSAVLLTDAAYADLALNSWPNAAVSNSNETLLNC